MEEAVRNAIIYSSDIRIGKVSAEADDEFLFSCFFDHPALAEIRSPASPKMFLLGSTGSGKTAFLKMIDRQEEKCKTVELDETSMTYIANSDVIRFLEALDFPLDYFFQALWKHVICLEYIRIKFQVDGQTKSESFWQGISRYFVNNQSKKKALSYLKSYESKFWVSMDENIREITEGFRERGKDKRWGGFGSI